MARARPLNERPIPSASFPPSRRRQRSRRSLDRQSSRQPIAKDQTEHGIDHSAPDRIVVIRVDRSCRSRPHDVARLIFSPICRRSAFSNVENVRRAIGQICSNVSRDSPVSHRSTMPSRRSSWRSNNPEPARKPSSQAEALAGSLPCDNDSERRSAAASGDAAPVSSSTRQARPATRPWMSASPIFAKASFHSRQQVGTIERDECALHADRSAAASHLAASSSRRSTRGQQARRDSRQQACRRRARPGPRRCRGRCRSAARAPAAAEPSSDGRHQSPPPTSTGSARATVPPLPARSASITSSSSAVSSARSAAVRAMRHRGRSRDGHGIAPLRRFDDLDSEFRSPLKLPDFVKRAGLAAADRPAARPTRRRGGAGDGAGGCA